MPTPETHINPPINLTLTHPTSTLAESSPLPETSPSARRRGTGLVVGGAGGGGRSAREPAVARRRGRRSVGAGAGGCTAREEASRLVLLPLIINFDYTNPMKLMKYNLAKHAYQCITQLAMADANEVIVNSDSDDGLLS